jgi:hypothetical protein
LEHVNQLKLLKNELNEIKNLCAEKERESLSWETKVQTLVEYKNKIKLKDSDLSYIETKKKEIHRMQVIYFYIALIRRVCIDIKQLIIF